MPASNVPISQNDIAKALGLGQSTVSLALRGSELVSEKTRVLVVSKAEEMGYSPDPKMTALTGYRRNSSVTRQEPTLAWVTNFPTEKGWKKGHNLEFYIGAKRRAAELGFALKEFWLRRPGVSKKQLSETFVEQGIRGVLFAAQQSLETKIDFDFVGLSAVSIGYSLSSPLLHSVSESSVYNTRLAIRSLQQRGYRRIGLASSASINSRVDGAFFGVFESIDLAEGSQRIPPFMPESFDAELFRIWFEKWKPDAIVVWGAFLDLVEEWLVSRNLKVGRDVALACLSLGSNTGRYAGIGQQSELIGEVAVGTVFSYLNQFAYGIPENAYQTTVDGVWIDGMSAPVKA